MKKIESVLTMFLSTQDFLRAGDGSQRLSNGWLATTNKPWLVVYPREAITRHRWVRLKYSSSFMDEPVRPLIRFTTIDGEVFVEPMNGTTLGSAEWLGRVPDHTIETAISPSRRIGPFNFRIDWVEGESTARLLWHGILRPNLWTYWTLRCLAVGSRREAWQALKSATEGTRLKAYASWHSKNARHPDFPGFDAPRTDMTEGPRFIIVLKVGHTSPEVVRRTLTSLTEQPYPQYVIAAVVDETTAVETRTVLRETMKVGAGYLEISAAGDWADLGASIVTGDWISMLDAADQFRPYALAAIAQELAETPGIAAIYADEDCITLDATLHSPVLKPDWSPIYQAQVQYVKRALFVDAAVIPQSTWQTRPVSYDFTLSVLDSLPIGKVHHLRRILYTRKKSITTSKDMAAMHSPNVPKALSPWPAVSVIIPTKDKAKLLAACLRGIAQDTDYPDVDIVIVDNGSTAPEAVMLLHDIEAKGKIKVIRFLGPFNFSKLCNAGAAASVSPILLFLNNDTEIRGGKDWLKAMVRWVVQPQVGAVGAKLLFPDGRIQHAGVVLGLSGIAGHAYLRQRENPLSAGNRLDVPYEISAVTGACFAVAREKFNAVGGFDEALAIDLNDIDLCLRLSERGWTSVWTPEAELVHRESSSRGVARNYFEAYDREIAQFVGRWSDVIRDDPFFHPGLSLYAHDIRLA
jgi:GT2 family glycosyltransferase